MKKLMNKKVIISIIAVVLVIAIICGGYFLRLHLIKSSAIKEVDKIFSAIKSGDEETLKQYVNEENSEDSDSENKEENSENKEMEKVMLSNLNYEILSADVKSKDCIVKLKVSNKNLKEVFSNYMQKAVSLAFSQAFGKISEEEMNAQMKQYFQEQYSSDSVETISNEITVTMTKKDGKWNMSTDEEQLVNAILPGYKEISNLATTMQ